jgi:hypothetical protein
MQYKREWMAVGLLLAAPLLLAQNPPAPSQAPPNQAPQTIAPPVPVAPSVPPSTNPPAAPGASPSAVPAIGAAAEPSTASHAKTHKVQKELVLPPLPSGPLPQMPMDQIPATPAKVNFQNGMLTISSQNSTLGEILRDVRKLTGAAIDIPAGSGATERVVAHLGPGAPRDVLAVLLNGSSFNYVMIGSSSDPTAVSSVILTSKGGESQTQTASNGPENGPSSNGPQMGGATPPSRFFPPMGPRSGRGENAHAADDNNDDAKDDDPAADDTAEDQSQQTPPPAQPDASANANANPQDQPQPDANQPNAGPKTPEQVLDMLRRQQPPAAAAPPPQPPQQ